MENKYFTYNMIIFEQKNSWKI